MDTEDETESRKSLDELKKKLQKELRNVDRLSRISKEVQESIKESLHHQLQGVEKRRHDLMPEHQKVQKRSQTIQSIQDKRRNLQKDSIAGEEEMRKLQEELRQMSTRYTSHFIFLMRFKHNHTVHITLDGSRPLNVVCVSASFHLHVIHDVCLSVRRMSLRVCPSLVSLRRLLLLFLTLLVLCPALPLQCQCRRGKKPLRHPMAIYHSPSGFEPKLLDNFDYSETSAMIFQDESGDRDTEPSYLCDAELDDDTIGNALSSPLFIQEREEPANLRQAYHSHEESLLPAQSSRTQER